MTRETRASGKGLRLAIRHEGPGPYRYRCESTFPVPSSS